MYLDVNAAKTDLAKEVFGSGRIFAYYDKETKQCNDLISVAVLEGEDLTVENNVVLAQPRTDKEALVEILNIVSNTVICQENYVDPETKSLLRKPKVELEWLADPDYNAEKQTIVVRNTPYKVRIKLVDYNDNLYTNTKPYDLIVKDRESILTIKDAVIKYTEPMTIEVKALYPGQNCCLRIKDSGYELVPGLLQAEVLPPSW